MAVQSLGGSGAAWPDRWGITAHGSLTLDATGEQICHWGRVWAPGWTSGTKNIVRVIFHSGASVSAGGSGWTVSLQDMKTASSFGPDGTVDQSVALTAAEVGLGNKWIRTAAFTGSASRTVNIGDVVGVVFEFNGGGRLGSDTLNIRMAAATTAVRLQYSPMQAACALYTGTWAISVNAPVTLFECDDGSYISLWGGHPFGQALNTNAITTTTGDGAEFTVPGPVDTIGCWFVATGIVAGETFNVCLYQGSTRLQTVPMNFYTQAGSNDNLYNLPWPRTRLTPGNTYRISIEATSGDASLYVLTGWEDSAEARKLLPGGGNFMRNTVTIATGVWGTASSTQQALMGLVVDGIDDGGAMTLASFPISQMLDGIRLATASPSTSVLDAVGEKIAYIVPVPKTGNITTFDFRATNTTDGDYTVELQTVNTITGMPTGDRYGGSSIETVTITVSGKQRVTFGTPASATKGDVIAVVITQSGTASNSFPRYNATIQQMPHALTDLSTGTWALAAAAVYMISFGYSDGSFPYMPMCYGSNNGVLSYSYGSTSTPDEYGVVFTPPGPLTLEGVWTYATFPAGQNVVFNLCSGLTNTTAVATLADLDGDLQLGAGAGWRKTMFNTPVNLTAGTVYILSASPSSTGSFVMRYWPFDSNAEMEASPGGKDVYQATRTDGGSTWTADTTKQLAMYPVFSAISDGAGGSGGGGVLSMALTGGRQL